MNRFGAKRWRLRRRALGVLASLALVLSACLVEPGHSAKQAQWRMPPQGEIVAAANGPREALGFEQRLQPIFAPVLVTPAAASPRQVSRTTVESRRRDGSLPPARRRYRRVVHDDRSDQPA